MLAFTASLVLFLLVGQQQYGLASAQMAVLKSLVQSNCLQRCYIAVCDDLEPRCVCQQLADKLEVGETCAAKMCNEVGDENASIDLWAECLSRRDELGIAAPTTGEPKISQRLYANADGYPALPAATTDPTDADATPPPADAASRVSSTHTSSQEATAVAEASPPSARASGRGA